MNHRSGNRHKRDPDVVAVPVSWSAQTFALFAVDLCGLALAASFARLAHATRHRARHGAPHNVWASAN